MLEFKQSGGKGPTKPALPEKKQPIIANWLSQFEERVARDFMRRTGLDFKKTIGLIIDTAEPFPGMQVADIPTGTGVIARQFVGRVGEKGRIIGVAETREKLEQARLTAQSLKLTLHIEWRVMPMKGLFFPSNSMDLVTCVMAFHSLKPERYLAEVYRVLKPGGRLLIADEFNPDISASSLMLSLRRAYYRYIQRAKKDAKAHFYTHDEMIKLLAGAGFNQYMFRVLRQRDKYDRIFTLIKAVK
jgi:ubiquinone/menaquinone biosynthesis C-methylase UbiE